MSYLVLARKWRPQTFEDVIGQAHITKTLVRALERGRIAHAYLFSGPRGVGKTTTARILAKALNCTSFDGPTATPCNECSACVTITEGRSGDVLEIDGASHRGIDDARELQTNIQYAIVGRYKVIIIDEVHMLTKEAFNALLKTLEEPPSNVVFVFATTEPDHVPLTIISRCQRFDFRRIAPRFISEHIKKITQNEDFSISNEAADFIAIRADGAVRDALSMLDQIMASEPDDEINLDMVMNLLGVVPAQSFQKIAESVGSKIPASALEQLEYLLECGIDPIQVARGLVEHFRNALIAKSGALPEDYPNHELYSKIAQKHTLHDLLRVMKVFTDTYSRLRYSDTPRYLLEETLIYIALIDEVVDIAGILNGLQSDKSAQPVVRKTAQNAASEKAPAKSKYSDEMFPKGQPTPKQPEAPIHEAVIEDEKLPDEPDKRFLASLAKIHKSMSALLKSTTIVIDDTRLLIKFPKSMETVREELLIKPENFRHLKEAAWKAFGPDIEVDLIKDSDESKIERESTNSGIQKEVSDVLTLFKAKLQE